jgi:hypothetical protein
MLTSSIRKERLAPAPGTRMELGFLGSVYAAAIPEDLDALQPPPVRMPNMTSVGLVNLDLSFVDEAWLTIVLTLLPTGSNRPSTFGCIYPLGIRTFAIPFVVDMGMRGAV